MMRDRVASLDAVRGIAVLGILLLNMSAFGLPAAAYLNPAYAGLPSFSDTWVWAWLAIVAQGKFLSLFILLFGASLEQLLSRGKHRLQARLAWLLLFGLGHTLLVWDGDILLPYAFVGLIVWRMIEGASSARELMRMGGVIYLIGLVVLLLLGWLAEGQPGSFWLPSAAELEAEAEWKRQGGVVAWQHRLALLGTQLLAIGIQYVWQLAGLMLFGAGLMRSGWLLGESPLLAYRRLGWRLVALGVLIQLPGIGGEIAVHWDYRWSAYYLQCVREAGAPMQGLGYLALCYGYWPRLAQYRATRWLVDAGRMSLSLYLLQSVLCSLIFYHFGLYQQFDRLLLLAMVPVVWCIALLFSQGWLHFFPLGPMEWLWRRLTQLTVQRAATEQLNGSSDWHGRK